MIRKRSWLTLFLFLLTLEHAMAVEFEPKGKAVAAVLGTKKAKSKKVTVDGKEITAFYPAEGKGKIAFVQEGLYPPNCTHTWVVGIDAAKGTVTEIRTVEMECPHAFPTKEASFLGQFEGKGYADLAKLDGVHTVAKATGSSKLAIDAVKRSIKGAKGF